MTKKINNKIKYIAGDFLNFVLPHSKTTIEKNNTLKVQELSEYQLQPAKNIIFMTKSRTTRITHILQHLIKKNKMDLRVYNGKKFFNITKRSLICGLKFGDYVFTRVNRRHVLKVRAQKKVATIKKK